MAIFLRQPIMTICKLTKCQNFLLLNYLYSPDVFILKAKFIIIYIKQLSVTYLLIKNNQKIHLTVVLLQIYYL